jgi:type IV secretion system protein VirB3
MALRDYEEPLFVAITQPMMLFGVPVEGFGINIGVWYLAYFFWGHANPLSIRGLESLLIGPALHMAMSVCVAYDPNIFRLLFLWIDTRGIQPRRQSVLWAARWWHARTDDEINWGSL